MCINGGPMSSKGPRACNLYNFNQSLMSRRCERAVICHRQANYLQRSEWRVGLDISGNWGNRCIFDRRVTRQVAGTWWWTISLGIATRNSVHCFRGKRTITHGLRLDYRITCIINELSSDYALHNYRLSVRHAGISPGYRERPSRVDRRSRHVRCAFI